MTAVHSRDSSSTGSSGLAKALVGLDRAGNASQRRLLVGVCAAAITAAGALPAMAQNFTAGTQAEFNSAIAAANASGDPNSTITLTGSFSLTAAPNAVTSNITVDTGSNTVTLGAFGTFDVESGATLSISGNGVSTALSAGGLQTTTGGGELVINGVVASGVGQIVIQGGTTLIDGGSTVAFNSTLGGTNGKMVIAHTAGQTATLTISGAGTVVTGGVSTDPIYVGGGTTGTLNVEDGGVLNVLSSSLETYDNGTINVTGVGSAINASSVSNTAGMGSINVRDGGLISTVGNATFGGAGLTVLNATVNGVVSGAGSELDVLGTGRGVGLYLQRGTLSVLDGGLVTANLIGEANVNRGTAAQDFDTLVSGDGSELNAATTFSLGITGTGTLTIADGGKVVVGGGTLTMGSTNAASHAVLNIGGPVAEAATGAGTLDAAAITLAASAEINFNHTDGGYVFDPVITGNGAINQVAGHTIFDADQSGFTGLTTISGGILEADNALGGTVDVIGGTLSGIGTVGPTTNEAGGTISPGGDSIGTLTIGGSYTGNGGTVLIQSVLGNDNSASDRLVVNGDTSGTTNLKVTNLGGAGAPTTNGIEVVDVSGTSAGTFALQGDYVFDGDQAVVGGAYAYRLYQGGVSTPDDGDWYLRSDLIPAPPSGPPTPLFQPGVPIYEAYANVLQSFNKLPTLQERVGNRSWSDDGQAEGSGTWGRIETSRTTFDGGTSTTGTDHTDSIWRLKGGADTLLANTSAGQLVAGAWGEYGTISSAITGSVFGAGSISSTGAGLGGSLTWYGRDGFYLDSQAQLISYDSSLSSSTANKQLVGSDGAMGYALSLEAGRRIGLGGSWSITPQAQLAYSAVNFDGFTDAFGAGVSSQGDNSLTGRLGLSADFEQQSKGADGKAGRTHAYGIANVYYDFGGGSETDVADVSFANKNDPLWGGIGVGGSYNWDDDKYSLYGEASANTSLNNFGQSYGFAGTGGFRVKW